MPRCRFFVSGGAVIYWFGYVDVPDSSVNWNPEVIRLTEFPAQFTLGMGFDIPSTASTANGSIDLPFTSALTSVPAVTSSSSSMS